MMGKQDQGTTDSYLGELKDITECEFAKFKTMFKVRKLKKISIDFKLHNLNEIIFHYRLNQMPST